jgi:imidazoleglycerol-phosphate dehydratase
MKIGIILYEGCSAVDVVSMQEVLRLAALQEQQAQSLPQLIACQTQVLDRSGLKLTADATPAELSGFDALLLPGCSTPTLAEIFKQPDFTSWLASIKHDCVLASADPSARLWKAAGVKAPDWFELQSAQQNFFTAVNGNIQAMTLRLIRQLYGESTTDSMQKLLEQPGQMERFASLERKTNETLITGMLNLDGNGKYNLESGIPFLDHMLQQIAVHGMVDLSIKAKGDLQVDVHHTLEDIGIVLGKLLVQALGDRKGIQRCASVRVPMDDSLAEVTLDFSGRAYCVFECTWHQPEIGGIPASLFQHFFESVSVNAVCNLHIRVPYGLDDHHQIEAIFKAFARAVDQASCRDPRRMQQIPSSKGVL